MYNTWGPVAHSLLWDPQIQPQITAKYPAQPYYKMLSIMTKSLQDLLEEKLIITKRTHFDRHPEPVEGCDRLPIKRNPKKDVKYDKTNPFRHNPVDQFESSGPRQGGGY